MSKQPLERGDDVGRRPADSDFRERAVDEAYREKHADQKASDKQPSADLPTVLLVDAVSQQRVAEHVLRILQSQEPAKSEYKLAESMRQLSQNPELQRKILFGSPELTEGLINSALLLDDVKRSGKRLGEQFSGPYLTDGERKILDSLRYHWRKDGTVVDKEVSGFASSVGAGISASISAGLAAKIEQSPDGQTITDEDKKEFAEAAEAVGKIVAALFDKDTTKDNPYGPPPIVRTADLREMSEKVFSRIDSDGNGYMSFEELGRAVQDDQFQGQEAQVVSALYYSREKLQGLKHDGFWFVDHNGVSMADLAKFDEIESKRTADSTGAGAVSMWASDDNNFRKVDADGNGFIEMREVERALQSSGISDQERAALQYMRDKHNDIEDSSNDEWFWENNGITRADIASWQAHVDQKGDDAELVGGAFYAMYRTSESQTGEVNRNLFADAADPINSINPDAIRQGTIGDCYFLAALASVAKSEPQLIRDMIKDNGNGTYTVTFPGAPDQPITVTAPTQSEMGLYNAGSKHGTWAIVLEKAFGVYNKNNPDLIDRFRRFFLPSPNTPSDGADHGGWPAVAVKVLTGRDSDLRNPGHTDSAELADKLDQAFNSYPKKAVTATTPLENPFLEPFGWSDEYTKDGFRKTHAFSIVGFERDARADGGGFVIVRNPWGQAEGTTGGTIRVPLNDFRRNFDEVSIER